MTPAHVGAMNDMLNAVLVSGTGKRAALPDHPAAGKTGTTQDFRDAWFVGYTAHLVGGVWVGNDDGQPMNHVMGGSLPARIWHDVMRVAHKGQAPLSLPGTTEAGKETARAAPRDSGRESPRPQPVHRAQTRRLRLRHRCSASFYRGRSRMRPSYRSHSLRCRSRNPASRNLSSWHLRKRERRSATANLVESTAGESARSGASTRADQRGLHRSCTGKPGTTPASPALAQQHPTGFDIDDVQARLRGGVIVVKPPPPGMMILGSQRESR